MVEIIGFLVIFLIGVFLIIMGSIGFIGSIKVVGWRWNHLWFTIPFIAGVYICKYSINIAPFEVVIK